MMALIRYPGSKEKLANAIRRQFPMQMKSQLWSCAYEWEYREPFFGAGAVGFSVLEALDFRCKVWINDFDYGMYSLWSAVHEDPKELMNLIGAFTPSVEHFEKFKAEDGRRDLPAEISGFRKLALHRMSFSGLGCMAGGPIGGARQSNTKYDIKCRWRPERMKYEIAVLHNRLKRLRNLKITNLDFEEALHGAGEKTFVYLDPPYYEKGPQLYKYGMTPPDHERLANLLESAPFHWVLSYDDHPAVRELYHWARIEPVRITYTTAIAKNGKRPKNQEVLIRPSTISAPA